jgi:hypothetical protein
MPLYGTPVPRKHLRPSSSNRDCRRGDRWEQSLAYLYPPLARWRNLFKSKVSLIPSLSRDGFTMELDEAAGRHPAS